MSKHRSGKQFMLGAMLGSTIGALSAMMMTTKKGNSFKKAAMEKLHGFETQIKRFVHKNKKHVAKTVQKIHKAASRKKSKKR